MGGFGSGDWADAVKRKTTVELCRSISARGLKDYGFFAENKTGVITWTNEFGEKTGTAKIQSFCQTLVFIMFFCRSACAESRTTFHKRNGQK